MEVKGDNGQISFDGRMIVITRKGVAARLSVGKGEKRIPLASVTAVQWKPAGTFTRGFIQFTVPGGAERRSQFGQQNATAAHDENTVMFFKKQEAEIERLKVAIENEMALAGRWPAQPPVAHPFGQPGVPPPLGPHGSVPAPDAAPQAADGVDVAGRLGRLRALLDQGLISQAQHDEQQARILHDL